MRINIERKRKKADIYQTNKQILSRTDERVRKQEKKKTPRNTIAKRQFQSMLFIPTTYVCCTFNT